MKMAMLSWTKLNPTVKELAVKKLFFNQYLYKVKVYCPGARLIYYKTKDEFIRKWSFRIAMIDPRYNYGGSWWANTASYGELRKDGKLDQLEHYFNLKNNKSVKIRVEEPYISLYSNSDQQLYDIVEKNYPERLTEVHLAVNDKAKDILLKGEILAGKDEQYSYKIFLRSTTFESISTKHALLDYFYNLDDLVKLPKQIKNQLNESNTYFSGGYFYSKDDSIVTFLHLFCPDLIASIFKLTKLD